MGTPGDLSTTLAGPEWLGRRRRRDSVGAGPVDPDRCSGLAWPGLGWAGLDDDDRCGSAGALLSRRSRRCWSRPWATACSMTLIGRLTAPASPNWRRLDEAATTTHAVGCGRGCRMPGRTEPGSETALTAVRSAGLTGVEAAQYVELCDRAPRCRLVSGVMRRHRRRSPAPGRHQPGELDTRASQVLGHPDAR